MKDYKFLDGYDIVYYVDGKYFDSQSAALDYLLEIWGNGGVCSAATCRLAEKFLSELPLKNNRKEGF